MAMQMHTCLIKEGRKGLCKQYNISSLEKCIVNIITSHSLQPSQQFFLYHKENDMQGIAPLCHPSRPCSLHCASTRHRSAIKERWRWHLSYWTFVIKTCHAETEKLTTAPTSHVQVNFQKMKKQGFIRGIPTVLTIISNHKTQFTTQHSSCTQSKQNGT